MSLTIKYSLLMGSWFSFLGAPPVFPSPTTPLPVSIPFVAQKELPFLKHYRGVPLVFRIPISYPTGIPLPPSILLIFP